MPAVISTVIITIALGFVTYLTQKENKNAKDKNRVRMPKAFMAIGAICVAACLAMLIALIVSAPEDAGAVWALFGMGILFALGGFSLITVYLNWRIDIVDNNKIIYRTFFRRVYEFDSSEMWIEKHTENDIIVIAYHNGRKKKFFVEPHAIGVDSFVDLIKDNIPR
jgi:hypothetical protein